MSNAYKLSQDMLKTYFFANSRKADAVIPTGKQRYGQKIPKHPKFHRHPSETILSPRDYYNVLMPAGHFF